MTDESTHKTCYFLFCTYEFVFSVSGERSSSGLIEFEALSESVEALSIMNHFPIKNTGKWFFRRGVFAFHDAKCKCKMFYICRRKISIRDKVMFLIISEPTANGWEVKSLNNLWISTQWIIMYLKRNSLEFLSNLVWFLPLKKSKNNLPMQLPIPKMKVVAE